MPCMCWYSPTEEDKIEIKNLCQLLVDKVRRLEKQGHPLGISIPSVKELIDHLYDPSLCKEKSD